MNNKNERRRALNELQQEISGCRRCVEAGFIPVAHPIFRGGIEQRWMILGQAPGAAAETHARPYSGASGKTLRGWLAQAGFDETSFYERFYLTSVTKCFPGSSPSGKGDRSPSGAEIALCRSHLDREIALVQPELVITLGKLAASVLIGPAALADIVGTLREAERAGQRFRVLPLPHPSGVSRWLNEPANRERHARALVLLTRLVHGHSTLTP
jgi:uracil-DNA glycosylase family 4